MSEPEIPNEMDVVVVGSGAVGLVCALFAAVGGLRVLVVEKSEKLGGTSAMSGGAVWVPANTASRPFVTSPSTVFVPSEHRQPPGS